LCPGGQAGVALGVELLLEEVVPEPEDEDDFAESFPESFPEPFAESGDDEEELEASEADEAAATLEVEPARESVR
jgi:hypothetical protein